MATTTKFSTVLANAGRNCWLALTEDESAVAGRGQTPAEAIDEAKRVIQELIDIKIRNGT